MASWVGNQVKIIGLVTPLLLSIIVMTPGVAFFVLCALV